jgi:hypothetical protein
VEPYRNLSGNSGIEAFEVHDRSIIVRFTSGPAYVYDYDRPGGAHVERMKGLAREGRGLSTYISQHVRDAFASKAP